MLPYPLVRLERCFSISATALFHCRFFCQIPAIPQAYAKLPDAFDTANACRKVGAEEATVSGLVRQAAYGTQSQVDGAGGQLPGLEVVSISKNDGPIEGWPGLLAIPVGKLINYMTISSLGIRTGQTVKNCGLGKLEIGEAQDGLGFLSVGFAMWLLLHGVWPPLAPRHDRQSVTVSSFQESARGASDSERAKIRL